MAPLGKVVGSADQPYCPGAVPAVPAPYAFGAPSNGAAAAAPTVPTMQRPQIEVVQLSCRDQGLPPDLRLNFIKKALGGSWGG